MAEKHNEVEEEKVKKKKSEDGKPLFYDIWGWSFNRFSLIFILIVFLAMFSMKMCDSKYIVKEGPEVIKVFP